MNLSCESVTKKIRNSTVIDNISFQWNGSNVYGLCGSNGSGKTMLLRIISGLIFPTSGCVKVNGKMLGKDLEFPPSMGMLLENPSFLNPYTGKKNLELIASLNGGKEDDVRKAILAVGLSTAFVIVGASNNNVETVLLFILLPPYVMDAELSILLIIAIFKLLSL